MSPEKTQALISIYPELFSNLDHRNNFYLFSFECDDGWFDLLKDLITEIKSIVAEEPVSYTDPDDQPTPLKVNQVKEKYATLRFYTNWSNDSIDQAVLRAENRSEETCEECGSPGKVVRTGYDWYKTLCENCIPVSSETFL